jgi:hypothetical protein
MLDHDLYKTGNDICLTNGYVNIAQNPVGNSPTLMTTDNIMASLGKNKTPTKVRIVKTISTNTRNH